MNNGQIFLGTLTEENNNKESSDFWKDDVQNLTLLTWLLTMNIGGLSTSDNNYEITGEILVQSLDKNIKALLMISWIIQYLYMSQILHLTYSNYRTNVFAFPVLTTAWTRVSGTVYQHNVLDQYIGPLVYQHWFPSYWLVVKYNVDLYV